MPSSLVSTLCLILISGFLSLLTFNLQTAFNMNHGSYPEVNVHEVVHFGAVITLQHVSTTGGYLSSLNASYPKRPASSEQQLVAVAAARSDDTSWRIYNASMRSELVDQDDVQGMHHVSRDATVILRHVATHKFLHSHQEFAAPVTSGEGHWEVTAYGMRGFEGDANDDWVVEPLRGAVLTTATPFRLRHRLTGCYLASREGAQLPEWGFGLQEVTCTRDEAGGDLWIIDAI
ncbi:glycosyltransferase family 39 protein [Favolaschia claudopus]|uniref:Glycosyltransferase family 39 protein n=1 Tax=Favolaschia claudopus TaxID=2862362 RepID=A0AAW0D1X9_9AGAR